ncbi:MAG: DUF2490 domain-containing protein [Bacteroidota bacterium]
MKLRIPFRSGCFTVILYLMFISAAIGQVKDAGLWTSLAFEAKLVKKISVAVSQEYRFNENITELDTWISETGLEYKLNKYLKASFNYRYTMKRKTNNLYSPRHRVFIDVKAEKKIKPFILQFRTRFQDEYADIGRAPDGGFAGYYSRNKFSLKFDLDRKWEPCFSVELFSPLRHNQPFMFDEIRSSAGLEYSVSKHHRIDVYYMIQNEMNVNNPVMEFIGGIGYQFKL